MKLETRPPRMANTDRTPRGRDDSARRRLADVGVVIRGATTTRIAVAERRRVGAAEPRRVGGTDPHQAGQPNRPRPGRCRARRFGDLVGLGASPVDSELTVRTSHRWCC